MIKILKEGKKPKLPKMIYRTSCKLCDCEFEFTLNECLSIEKRIDGYMIIKCPCCSNAIKCSRLNTIQRESVDKQED